MSEAELSSERQALLSGQTENERLKKFCEAMGINTQTGEPTLSNSFYGRVLKAHFWQAVVYYTLATTAITILAAQVVFSAVVVVLAADKKDYHLAIEVLGAITTVISFIAGYIKSMGQPTRARQFMDALQQVRYKIDEGYGMYRSGCAEAKDPCAKANELEELFRQARLNALANIPDVWVDVNVSTGRLERGGNLPV